MKQSKKPGVRLTKAGGYEISFSCGGKRFYQTVYAESLKEAYDIREERRLAAKTRKSCGAHENINISLPAAWEEIDASLMAEKKPKKTLGKYRNIFNRLFYDFPKEKGFVIAYPSQLNLGFIERYRVWYAEKATPSGVRSELVMVKALIRRMRRMGFVDKTLAAELSELKTPRMQGEEVYTDVPTDKLRDLLNKIKDDNECFYDFFVYLLITGRRPHESTLIEKSDIEWSGWNPSRIIIRSEITKMRTNAPIEIHPTKDTALIDLLRRTYKRYERSPYLFTNRKGKRLSCTTLRNYLNTMSESVLGQKLNMKFFRKRFATECGKNNVPAKDAMRRSGHRDINVFIKHYQQATKEGLGSVIKAVAI